MRTQMFVPWSDLLFCYVFPRASHAMVVANCKKPPMRKLFEWTIAKRLMELLPEIRGALQFRFVKKYEGGLREFDGVVRSPQLLMLAIWWESEWDICTWVESESVPKEIKSRMTGIIGFPEYFFAPVDYRHILRRIFGTRCEVTLTKSKADLDLLLCARLKCFDTPGHYVLLPRGFWDDPYNI